MSFAYIIILQRYQLSEIFKFNLALALFIHAIFTTVLVTLTEGKWQFRLFHLSFGSVEIYALTEVIKIITILNPSTQIFKLGVCGILSYAFGILVWSIDLFYCDLFDYFNPQLHAFWHIFVRFGIFLMTVLVFTIFRWFYYLQNLKGMELRRM